MSGINMPQKKRDNGLSNIMTIGGAVVGGAYGGPAGAAGGASLGGMAGGMLNKPGVEKSAIESSALSRRQQELDNSPQRQLRESIDSLKYIEDPQQRMELAAPLIKADMAARKQYG